MANYDGSLKFDTSVDSKGFNTGVNNITSKMQKMTQAIKAVGVAIAGSFVVKEIKNTIEAAEELQNAMTGLKSIMDGQGKSFEQAQTFINKYTEDGLIPASNAITAYKNLALRGYNTDQIEKVMNALKDSATYGRQSSYTLGQAVQTAAEGLKNENSILVDNAGVTKNVAKMWQDYAKQVGKTTNNLTQQEKIQAEVNGILEETKFQTGDSSTYVNSYSGQVARLNQQFITLKQNLGTAFKTLAQIILPTINKILSALTKVAQIFSALVSSVFNKAVKTNNNITKTTQESANSISSLGDSVEEAGKQVSEALLPFDDLNVLQQDLESGSSDISVGSVLVDDSDLNSLLNLETDIEPLENFENQVNKIKTLLNTIFDPFKKAWDKKGKYVLNNADKLFKSLKKLIGDVTSSLELMFKSESFQKSIENLILSFGRIERIIQNVVDAFGIAWASEETGSNLTKNLCELFEELTYTIDLVLKVIENFSQNQALANFFKDAINWINSFTGVIKGVLKILNGVVTKDWKKVWDGLDDISKNATTAITGNIVLMKDGAELAISSFVEEVEKDSNEVKNTIVTNAEGTKVGAGRSFDELAENIEDKTYQMSSKATNNFNVMHSGASRSFYGIEQDAKTSLNEVSQNVNTSTSSIKQKFIDAFYSIYNFIKAPINGILGAIETMVNGVISGLNCMIRALNKLDFSIPSWVPIIGGNSFSINLSQIGGISLPRLATGAVIPPNAEFAAILGDQKNGRNLEAPEGLIREIVHEEVSELANRPIYVKATISEKTLMNIIAEYENDRNNSIGYTTGGGTLAY